MTQRNDSSGQQEDPELALMRGINRIFHEALGREPRDELEQVCLEVARVLTNARRGFLVTSDAFAEPNPKPIAVRPFATSEIEALCDRVLRDGTVVIVNAIDEGAHSPAYAAAGDGLVRTFLGVPLNEETGEIIGMIGVADRRGGFCDSDVEIMKRLGLAVSHVLQGERARRASAREDAELNDAIARKRQLAIELQHGMRNMLAAGRSIFTRTAMRGGSLDEILDHFRGRFDAMARIQLLLLQSPHGQAQLEDLLRDELLSIGVTQRDGIVIEGPDVSLPPEIAGLLGLAIHELSTNAAKFGALKIPGAQLRVTWTVDQKAAGQPCLHILWAESGIPAVPVHPARGFGTELIDKALPERLGARTQLDFPGGGMRCRISVGLQPEDPAAIVGII